MFNSNYMYSLQTKDFVGNQYVIHDNYNTIFSKHYGEEGSGFGFLTFTLNRDTSKNYPDIGHGFRITLRKGAKTVLFHGRITRIEEGTNDELNISAVGDNTLLSFDFMNLVLVDNRVNRWIAGCTPRGSYRPDKFDHSLNWSILIDEVLEIEETYDGIEIKPRKGVKYNEEDYYYLRYRFEFGEVARRLQATYDIQFPNAWPGIVTIEDATETALQTFSTSGSGVLDISLDDNGDGNFVTIKIEVTTTGINTAEEDAVYVRFWDLKVSSEATDVTATTVITKVAEHMRDNFDFSDDFSLIDTNDYVMDQAAYEDKRLNEICTEAVRYGTAFYSLLAWGVYFDDTDRLFLETQPIGTLVYVIQEADDYSVVGDLTDSYQKVYGKYTDTFGRTQRTEVFEATDVIDGLGGLYRKEVIEIEDITEEQAEQLLTITLSENEEPKITAEFTVIGNIHNTLGGEVAVEDILPGKLVTVPEFRAREAIVLDDKRKGTHTFMIKVVEVNLDERKARIIPADNRASFETYMEIIKRLSK